MRRDGEAWERMVLRSAPKPAWLADGAPAQDVVLSSRHRVMRNLRGRHFPNRATSAEAISIMREVLAAAEGSPIALQPNRSVTTAERNFLVACRLVSPEFPWTEPGRALLVDSERSVSLMVNEEDHLRLQSLTAGWSLSDAIARGAGLLGYLEQRLEFACSPKWGYLAASPYNAGAGIRLSTMMHLVGLAHTRRLPASLRALSERGIAARGLFGESSRAIGAFVQVSSTSADATAFVGACDYLIGEERTARRRVAEGTIASRVAEVREFVRSSRQLDLASAFRVLGWLRFGAVTNQVGALPVREVDAILTTLQPGAGHDDQERASRLRKMLKL